MPCDTQQNKKQKMLVINFRENCDCLMSPPNLFYLYMQDRPLKPQEKELHE